MNDAAAAAAPPGRIRRIHRALMPDYNLAAAVFWWTVVALGFALMAVATIGTLAMPLGVIVQIAGCALIAALTGFVPIRIPRSTNSFAAGEIFIFFVLLLHGPLAGALVAGAEAFVATLRTSRRWTSRLSSPAMAGLSIFATGWLWHQMTAALRALGWLSDGVFLLGAIAFAVAYFAVNTWLMTALFHIKKGEWPPVRSLWRSHQWLAVAYAGSASVAALLALSFQTSGVVVAIAAVPIIAILLLTGHKFFRQQELEELARVEREKAAAQEAEMQRRHLDALQESERRFHRSFTHASIGMALMAQDGRLLQTNQAFGSLLGIEAGSAVELNLRQFLHPEYVGVLDAELARLAVDAGARPSVDVQWRHVSGADVWVTVDCSLFSEPGSDEPCFIVQAQDISARRRAEEELQRIAYQDALTGLPNRFAFNAHLARAMERYRADPARAFAVLFLDFDRFKLINDSLGHSRGDEFLLQAAQRITGNLRPDDVAARLGGDEFALLVHATDAVPSAVVLAERLQTALRQPFRLDGKEVSCSVSIGITFSGLDYTNPEEALRDADIAMYKAKSLGKARHAVFDTELHNQVSKRLELESELRRALGEGSLWVAYQPLFNLRDGTLRGFEALARWRHPQLGDVSPGHFVPVAEEAGLMPQLTDLVLGRACRRLAEWQAAGPAFADLTMNVNIAGSDLATGNLVRRVSAAVLEAGIATRHLTIELTEDILMERLAQSLATLNELRELGVRLSVDDFGTGYSSLSHLSTLPIDSLKIDRSFVQKLHHGSKEAAVIRAIVLLGHSLGKTVVAEGIEDELQLDQLKGIGCDVGQGYFLSRPLPSDGIDGLIESLSSRQVPVAAMQAATALLH